MQDRRTFIKNSALAVAGTALLSGCGYARQRKSMGIQVYTLRDQIKEDLEGTLKKLADIGYTKLELFGYQEGKFFGKTAPEFRKICDKLGLRVVSGHYLTGRSNPEQKGTLVNDWQMAIDHAAEVGQEYMVVAYLKDFERKNLDDYYKVCDLLNTAGEQCSKSGLKLCYHNHAFEFDIFDGQVAFEVMMSRLDPQWVNIELDHYWVKKAGYDSLALFEKYPGRFPLWHVKDMDSNGDFTEVGTGIIDYDAIFAKEENAGLDHFFIEQDKATKERFESITISYNNAVKFAE